MKGVHSLLSLITIMAFLGCNNHEQDVLEAPKKALYDALQKLNSHDFSGYMESVDLSDVNDSLQIEFIQMALAQHQSRFEEKKGSVSEISIIDAKMKSDSVCTVFYQYTFVDGSQETSSQKIVRVGDTWKVRLRN